MTPRDAYDRLLARYADLRDLEHTSALLSWDQETMMPPQAAEARARQRSTLAGLSHERFTDPEVGEWLATCHALLGAFDDDERLALAELQRDYDRATKLPATLVRELASAESTALTAWSEARPKSDFAAFLPHLRTLITLNRRKSEAYGYEDAPYDGLLDLYERGATEADIATLFGALRRELTPLVAAVFDRLDAVDASPVLGDFDEEAQAAFGIEVARAMGFDFGGGRVDLAAHPFCTTLGHGDVRLTRRFDDGDLRGGLYGIVHEAGHGLYEQGLPADWSHHPLGQAVSLGVHESQSRLWENLIARTVPFWEHFLPSLRRHFPGRFDQTTSDQMFRAVNQVERSLVRVDADELTYNLHVILRFEVERRLFDESLDAADVPEFWNAQMQEMIGVTPPDLAHGCLQDIHWALGAFGYFPTYTLGTLYASQLEEAARRDLPNLDDAIAHGRFAPLREWLRTHIHAEGKRHAPRDLIERATGSPPTADAFLRHIRRRMKTLYDVSA